MGGFYSKTEFGTTFHSKAKPDVYVVMIKGDVEVCAMGVFSNFEKAKEFVSLLGNGRPVWIEKFRPDDPSYYEDEEEYIVWCNTEKNIAFN